MAMATDFRKRDTTQTAERVWAGEEVGKEVELKKQKQSGPEKKERNRKANMILRNKVTTDHDNLDTVVR